MSRTGRARCSPRRPPRPWAGRSRRARGRRTRAPCRYRPTQARTRPCRRSGGGRSDRMPRPSRCGRSRSCPSCRRASSDSAGDRWSGRCRRSGRPACRCSPSGCPCPGPRVRCGRQSFRPARRSSSGRCRTARAPSASSRRAAASPDPRSSRARLSAALSRLVPCPLLGPPFGVVGPQPSVLVPFQLLAAMCREPRGTPLSAFILRAVQDSYVVHRRLKLERH